MVTFTYLKQFSGGFPLNCPLIHNFIKRLGANSSESFAYMLKNRSILQYLFIPIKIYQKKVLLPSADKRLRFSPPKLAHFVRQLRIPAKCYSRFFLNILPLKPILALDLRSSRLSEKNRWLLHLQSEDPKPRTGLKYFSKFFASLHSSRLLDSA